MFNNMKLAAKITFGFALLIIVALIIGIFGLKSVKNMAENFSRSDAGNQCLSAINNTGNFRRDFAIYGYTIKQGDNMNAAEKWITSYEDFLQKLTVLRSLKDLDKGYIEKATAAQKKGERYKEAFLLQKEAQSQKDAAFAEWGKIGEEVTVDIENIKTSDLGSLRQHFVEPFLLLRVAAVYLLATDNEEQWTAYTNQIREVGSGLKQWYGSIAADGTRSAIYSRLYAYVERYEAAGNQYWESVIRKNTADKVMANEARDIVELITSIRSGLENDMVSMTRQTTMTIVMVIVLAIVSGFLLSFFITRSIVGPINRVINNMTGGSEQVASASEQLASTSQQMSEGASEQASSLEEISSSLEEMSSMTKQNATNSRQATTMATDASNAAKQGKEKMQRMDAAINRIKQSSDETAKIVKTIDEIAMQTNLLALNAAVEAARAGEAGRGFAVVAEEVRNLAQRSADAAKNTADLIAESQKNAENGVGASQEVNSILEDIAVKIQKVDQLIAEVSSASSEQTQGIDQINTAVGQMDTVTQQNAANSEESASASEELSGQAQQLNAMVAELTRIVGGASSGSPAGALSGNCLSEPRNKRYSRAITNDKINPRHVSDQRNYKPAHSFSPSVKPETVSMAEIIPLDDDPELQNF